MTLRVKLERVKDLDDLMYRIKDEFLLRIQSLENAVYHLENEVNNLRNRL